MSIKQQDFLRECMSDVGQAPIDQFTKAFCFVCGNLACTRSIANNQALTKRAQNWKDDLFDKVPRAADNDHQYDNIRAKKFLPVIQSGTVSGGWTAPETTTQNVKIVQGPVSIVEKEILEEVKKNPISTTRFQYPPAPLGTPPVVPEPESIPEVIQKVQTPPKPVQELPGNTPFTQGTMLPGTKPDVIVESGATFTFGGGDDE